MKTPVTKKLWFIAARKASLKWIEDNAAIKPGTLRDHVKSVDEKYTSAELWISAGNRDKPGFVTFFVSISRQIRRKKGQKPYYISIWSCECLKHIH
jgi:hypothetical protein